MATSEAVGIHSPLRTRIRATPPGRVVDVVLALGLAALTFVVHDVRYVTSAPYWLDETWVVVSTRMPVSAAPHVTSASPLGWTILLRVAFFGGDQRHRMIPLLFAAGVVVLAYLIGNALPWRSEIVRRLAGVMAASAVLLAPSSLVRNDLKQYTADAFFALLLLFLLARAERGWSRTRLAVFGTLAWVAFLFSAAALFAAVAGFAAMAAVCVARRQWTRLLEVAVTGAAVAITNGVLFLVIYLPHQSDSLTAYWRAYYLPLDRGFKAPFTYLHLHGEQLASYMGVHSLTFAIILVLGGIVTLCWIGQPMLALAGPFLVAEMVVLGAAKKYPLFDERTSHFLTVTLLTYAAIGVAGLCALLARRTRTAAVVIATVAVALFGFHVQSYVRGHTLPKEDVRTPVAYVQSHVRANDVILVSSSANWGFGYYWGPDRPDWRSSDVVATNFQVYYPHRSDIIVATDRTPVAVADAMSRALRRMGTSAGARLWIVRMHVTAAEDRAWSAALASHSLAASPVIRCGLVLVTPATTRPSAAEVKRISCSG